MSTTWTFPGNGIFRSFRATLDPAAIDAYGGSAFPHLSVGLHFETSDPPGSSWTAASIQKKIWAAGVDVCLPTYNDAPVCHSGLQPIAQNSPGVSIPVTARLLETVSDNLSGDKTNVMLPLRVTILVDPQTVADDPDVGPVMTSEVYSVSIPVAQWHQQILPKLGFPETRLVPLVLHLPALLATASPAANQRWANTVNELGACVDLFRAWHFEPRDLVRGLRPVVEGALSTWMLVWGFAVPGTGKADDMLQQLNGALNPPARPRGVKPCKAPEGIIPASAPHKRLCVALTMLHDLLQLSNIETHAASRGTYTLVEAESLLYMVVGVTRSLPDLWAEYPQPVNANPVTSNPSD